MLNSVRYTRPLYSDTWKWGGNGWKKEDVSLHVDGCNWLIYSWQLLKKVEAWWCPQMLLEQRECRVHKLALGNRRKNYTQFRNSQTLFLFSELREYHFVGRLVPKWSPQNQVWDLPCTKTLGIYPFSKTLLCFRVARMMRQLTLNVYWVLLWKSYSTLLTEQIRALNTYDIMKPWGPI